MMGTEEMEQIDQEEKGKKVYIIKVFIKNEGMGFIRGEYLVIAQDPKKAFSKLTEKVNYQDSKIEIERVEVDYVII